MGYNITVSSLVTNARQRANKERSNFVTDAEILQLVDRAYKELYDLVVTSYQDYYAEDYDFTTVGGQKEYALPSNFYKLLGVDMYIDADRFVTLRQFMFQERNKYRFNMITPTIPAQIMQYHILGSNLRLMPSPTSQTAMKVWFVPRAKNLTTSASPGTDEVNQVDCQNGWEDFIITSAAIYILIKEESDVTALMAMKEEAKQRVLSTSVNRNTAEPERVYDVGSIADNWRFFYSWYE
ncbi:hypothetical protein EBT31_15120 [bacterium]|nr:hypothetical protein [bacterium]